LGFTSEQSKFSYFRKKDCVSLLDLRAGTSDQAQVEAALYKYYFLNLFPSNRSVFLLLKGSCFERLIPWTQSIDVSAMVVPYVEAGYPGEIPLPLIEHILIVDVVGSSSPQQLQIAEIDDIVGRVRAVFPDGR
jgi:hypothetical protein